MVYPETIEAVGVVDYDKWLEPKRFEYKPQDFRDYDVDIEIECCGVCGSDIHAASGNWGKHQNPLAVGHEIVGKIVKIGPNAKEGLKLGDRVGVGAQCDCDSTCIACVESHENNCRNAVGTYQSKYKESGIETNGGNASHIRVNSKLAFKIPDNLPSEVAAPLLCGGITGFSPLLQAKVGKGTKVAVAGIGGIGHMTILFAKALGAEVTAVSRNTKKEQVSKELGADHYAATDDDDFEKKFKDTVDVFVNTTSSFTGSSFDKYLSMLKPRGQLYFITAPPAHEQLTLPPFKLLMNNISVHGSAIGAPHEIEYMLELASKENIRPWVQTVDINEKSLGETWDKTERGDVKFRYTMTGYDKFFKH
ncbi:hypothetical protein PUMCH_001626 [Australozyma saopauloensis]|uniref:Enoyl reductase (ER) domain-containing protein n=1 Tax=Australozyma saopauloensis TaxID=291208 RepID=A0AAX4H720_9ASCO|nr:hypothetical protein PUMCH_001626 [[Candida] saopauloensis]